MCNEKSADKAIADILVIDDTPENLALLSRMLTENGYKVRSVTKGLTGLRGAIAVPPDLILLDVKMPQIDGYEVCQKLKADERTRHIPVIFISASGDVLDKVKGFQVGGVDYITKPFKLEEVLARLQTHLTICKLQKQLEAQNTELQQEIKERTAAEEKFAKAFRSCPNPIAIATIAEGRILDVNSSFLSMTHYTYTEIIGKTIADIHLKSAIATYAEMVRQSQVKGFVHNQECQFKTKYGEIKTVLLSVELIDLAGTPCTLSIMNDITEHKRLENEFISLVSHELRTPMTSMMGALDLLGSGQFGTLTEQGKQVLNIGIKNTERLIRLVNDILDLERMKSGKITMQQVKYDLVQLLTHAIETMQPMAEQLQISLSPEIIDSEPIYLYIDPDRILQTLTNLLSNGIKFSEPHQTIYVKVEKQANWVQVAVKDSGRGIPAHKLRTIFDRFQQVDASDSRQKGGTGLGLAICRHIVEQHNGKIWVESVVDQGSTFYVNLPWQSV